MKTSIIIPAYNEEKRIGNTIKSLKGLDNIDEIIVIDDGSVDDTLLISKKNGAIAIRGKHEGKGAALRNGLRYANGDIIVFIDADVGIGANKINNLIHKVKKNECDVAVVKFPPPKKKGGLGFVKGLSKLGVLMLTGKKFDSILSGQRVYKKEVLENIIIPDGFAVETAMTIDTINKGYNIKEYELEMSHRETGKSIKDFVHRGKQFKDILNVLIKKLTTKKDDKIC